MSSNHVLYEGDVSVYEKLQDKNVDVGDTIEYIPNNQQGYMKYKVINELGKKGIKLIESYDDWIGGMRKTRKRKITSNKRRKSNKRGKSNKHGKSNKRRRHTRR
jgi:hypothetical protein